MPERQPWITLDQRDPKDNFPILPTSVKPLLHSKERSPEVRAQHRDNLHQHFNSQRCRKQDKRPERWLERGRSSPHKFHLLVNPQSPFWPMKTTQALQCPSLQLVWKLKTPHLCFCCQSPEAEQKLPAVLGACWHSVYPGRDRQTTRMKQSPWK